ncbi:hypothetical protein JHW43_008457 [Diplocarpon mali]|nr:hypothetical protein JHW43_008457 [Diplocarpon mali]
MPLSSPPRPDARSCPGLARAGTTVGFRGGIGRGHLVGLCHAASVPRPHMSSPWSAINSDPSALDDQGGRRSRRWDKAVGAANRPRAPVGEREHIFSSTGRESWSRYNVPVTMSLSTPTVADLRSLRLQADVVVIRANRARGSIRSSGLTRYDHHLLIFSRIRYCSSPTDRYSNQEAPQSVSPTAIRRPEVGDVPDSPTQGRAARTPPGGCPEHF